MKLLHIAKKSLKKLARGTKRQFGPMERVAPQAFSYSKPERPEGSKKEISILCRGPTMRGAVHVVRRSSGEWLHSHRTVDGFWMVLKGKVRFYGDDDVLFGEFGPMEGIMTPRHTRYRFESTGDGDAELLQILHFDKHAGFERKDHEAPKFDRKTGIKRFDARTSR